MVYSHSQCPSRAVLWVVKFRKVRDPVTYHTTSEWNVKHKEGLAEKMGAHDTHELCIEE